MVRLRKNAVAEKSLPTVKLPTAANRPSNSLEDYCIALHGEKGIGKTTLASQFPGALVMQLEPARRNLAIKQYEVPVQTAATMSSSAEDHSWEIVQAVVQEFCESSYKCLVVDTVDRAYDYCLDCVCYRQGIEHPNDARDYGKTWDNIRREFEQVLLQPKNAGKGLILVSHSKYRTIAGFDGQEYDVLCPTAKDAAFQTMKALCDFAFYYGYRGHKRWLYLRGDSLVWAACGVEDAFLAKDGRPLAEVCLDVPPKVSYKRLQDAFANKLSPPKDCLVVGAVGEEEEKPKKKIVLRS